jgi:phytoene/squalene synthetase
MTLTVAWSYHRCKHVIKKHSASFFTAFSKIRDPKRRHGIYAVYAYCRYVDDLIDEHQDLPKLLAYKSELDDFVKGYQPRGFRWRALADTRRHFYHQESDFRPFYEMIEGQEFDAKDVRIQTVPQLLQYCDLVASSVGKMLLPILAPHAKIDLTPFANALGRAFQLTNILRDIGEDFRLDRVYLPASLMNEFGYDMDTLRNQTITPEFIALWEHLAKIAESYYQEAKTYLKYFPKDTRLPLLASLMIYRQILTVIRQNHYQVMTTKHYVSLRDKMALLETTKKEMTTHV